MYPEASLLGISYEAFWEMKPIEIIKVAEAKEKDFIANANFQLSMAWYTASLQGIAFNNPKKFPRKPPKIETKQDKLEKSKQLAYFLDALSRK